VRSLICKQPYQFEYAAIDAPELKPNHAIIKIKRIGICGTDLHAFNGTQPFFNYPRILGHELSGDLIDFDGAAGFVPGDVVTIIPYFTCGSCIACRNGKPNCCVNIKVCGVHIDGGMLEYLSVPSYSLVGAEGLSYDELALIEPLAIGAHSIRRAEVKEGEFVLIIGAGPIGLGTMEFARIAGGKVIAMDVNEERLRFCKETLGIEYVMNAADKNIEERVKEITNGDMPTVVMDATGNQAAINNGLKYVAHGGRYVLIGLQKDELIFSHPEFHKRETTLMSSRNATRNDFEHVIRSMKNGSVNPSVYITHRVKFHEVKDNFESWLKRESGVIKAIIEMD
jgi:2-desacetyl-2-hydroxyethyl bacteriochlorophyllide A dehydrogenase